jgi:hypothetical protein
MSMKPDSHEDVFEQNLRRLVRSTAGPQEAAFQERLRGVVRAEVARQRWMILKRRVVAGLSVAAAVVLGAWMLLGRQTRKADQVRPISGVVEVTENGVSRMLATSERIHAGSSIKTWAASTARITLEDGTTMALAPRSALQIGDGNEGPVIRLQSGSVEVTAAHQRPGRTFVIETPGSRIRTLGTVFGVRIAKKPDGRSRTAVAVQAGLVEFQAAGGKVLLSPRTEGFAEEGQAPQIGLANPMLNEMLDLLHANETAAQQLGKKAGTPAIIEYGVGGTAAVWTVVRREDFRRSGTSLELRLKAPASGARLYTFDGREATIRAEGLTLQVGNSWLNADDRLILELRGLKGIFQSGAGDSVRFASPGGRPDVVTLLRFELPEQARIERVSSEPLETKMKFDKLWITISTDAERIAVWE